jgi:hypothetical protein
MCFASTRAMLSAAAEPAQQAELLGLVAIAETLAGVAWPPLVGVLWAQTLATSSAITYGCLAGVVACAAAIACVARPPRALASAVHATRPFPSTEEPCEEVAPGSTVQQCGGERARWGAGERCE